VRVARIWEVTGYHKADQIELVVVDAKIRRFSHISTYWDGIQLGVMQRKLICIYTEL
ncbi:hypothetical protein A2U01_0041086, partial [Trifolium medium]|nr:hypothetical protein [Trifolium medium]